MDTSETYIKMCDCPEIQEQAPEDNMDLFHEWYACGVCGRVYHEDDGYYFVSCDHGKCVWLPRQDQLQEMWLEYTKFSPLNFILKEGFENVK